MVTATVAMVVMVTVAWGRGFGENKGKERYLYCWRIRNKASLAASVKLKTSLKIYGQLVKNDKEIF